VSGFDVETLNLIHQDVVFQLECASVRFELCDQLALQAEVEVHEMSALAKINLNDDYSLVVRPARPGFNGVNTWFKWYEVNHPTTDEVMIFPQARCVVELEFLDPATNEASHIFSLGIEAQSMQELIQKALAKFSQHCGLRLVALPQTKLNKTIN
jgi:hypothetical protein